MLVRRSGIVQAFWLLVLELTRETRLSRFLTRYLAGYVERLRMKDSTVLRLRPFSMDVAIFHEVWDHERYTAGPIGEVARHGTVVDIGAHMDCSHYSRPERFRQSGSSVWNMIF